MGMGNSKSTRPKASDLGLTPHEEQLLRGYFSRRTRPYLVAIVVLLCLLGAAFSMGLPGANEAAQADAVAVEVERATAAMREEFEVELAQLRAELEAASDAAKQSAAAQRKHEDTTARIRIEEVGDSMSGLAKRIDAMEKSAEATQAKVAYLEERRRVEAAIARGSSVTPAWDGADGAPPN